MALLPLTLSALSLLACSPELPLPINAAGTGAFFDQPWPSALRLNPVGGPTLEGFPKSEEIPLLAEYLALADAVLTGASTVGPVYMRFDAALDASLFPSPEQSIASGATVFLVDVDPRSPFWAQRVPISIDFQGDETAYQSSNLLAIAPYPGFALRPDTDYAAIVTTALAERDPILEASWGANHEDAELWDPVQAALFELGVPVEQVAIATTFTTQDPIVEMTEIAWSIREHLGHQDLSQPLEEVDRNQFFRLYEGEVYLPIWQHGERPYASEGGGFRRDESGQMEIADWERVTFSLSIPLGQPPVGGWPVALYAHGTGGDHRSCCDTNDTMSEAAMLAKADIATFGFAQPLHGDRATAGTSVELHTFNILNPESGRTSFRQGAADVIYLAHMLARTPQVFDTDQGETPLDPERVLFLGHSQGGITGAIALPYIGDDVPVAAISGAGGGLALSLIHRKQGGLDLEALIVEALDFDSDETLDALHPVAGLIQALTDVTDSLNYAPYWHSKPAPLGTPPVSVLMFEGLLDEHTPPVTTEALAASGGVPVLEPVASMPLALTLRGLGTVTAPVSENVVAWDGSPITTALAQFPEQDHFAIYNDPEAAGLYQGFLEAASTGAPVIGD